MSAATSLGYGFCRIRVARRRADRDTWWTRASTFLNLNVRFCFEESGRLRPLRVLIGAQPSHLHDRVSWLRGEFGQLVEPGTGVFTAALEEGDAVCASDFDGHSSDADAAVLGQDLQGECVFGALDFFP